MEQHVNEIIRLSEFRSMPDGCTHIIGVKTSLNLPLAILGLGNRIRILAEKRGCLMEVFHTHERNLYEPLEEILIALLPRSAVIDHEPVLKLLSNSNLRSDLTIRLLECCNNDRLANHKFAAIIEIKSVFYKENLSESDILEDLEKLLACEIAYSAKCFFVLVGLPGELIRLSTSLKKLLLYITQGTIRVELPSGKTAYLHPSARSLTQSPHIYVWTVSNKDNFGKNSSDYTYTVFHSAT